MVSTLINTLALAASAAALTTSAAGTQNGCYYNVAGVGAFNTKFSADFTTGSSLGSDFAASTYTVASGNSPFARRFDLTNLGYSSANTALTLTVPGAQTAGPISSSQLVTAYSDILYGSVRTVAKISSIPGVTHGFTFYANDTQEIDFAFITGDTTIVHLTNEATDSSLSASTLGPAAPADATTKFHEYRVDWTPSSSTFYIDSVLVGTLNTNVPSTAGFWVWNNWSNGNTWAAGPPTGDAVLQIQSITGYVNRTSIASNIASGAQVCAVSSSSSSSAKSTSTSVSSSSSGKSTSTSVSSSSVAPVTTAAAVVASTSSAKITSTSSSASSSSGKSTSTTSSVAAGATAGATCGTWLGGVTTACASDLTCTLSGFYYTCVADKTTNSKSNFASH